jgi:peptidoglycan/xylan/chitin deacetylase (PgdA/CDA1 family)
MNHPGLAVVTYHGLVPPDYQRVDPALDGSLVATEVFRQQLCLLKSNYNVISPDDLLAWCHKERELPSRAVLITCDDGLHSNLTEMLPILQAEGLRCLFFVTGTSAGDVPKMLWYQELFLLLLRAPAVKFHLKICDVQISGRLDSLKSRRELCWNMVKQLSRVDVVQREHFLANAHSYFGMKKLPNMDAGMRQYFGLMTRADLRQLVAADMTIGAHTLTHPVLSEQPPELAWSEIVNSRALLESVVGRRVWAFAYPFGGPDSVSPQVFAMVRQSGFAAMFTNVGGGLGTDFPLYAIPRVHVNADMTVAELDAHLSGFHEKLHRSFRRASANTVALDVESSELLPVEPPVSKTRRAV